MVRTIEVGRVVYSIAGRDQGRFFVIVEVVDDTYVKIADGDLRRLDCPKLKKIKHINPQEEVLTKIAEKITEGKKVFDAELKSCLRSFNANI